jgi:pimeloyl-ACP methyl ester carboxylesterase
MPEPTVAQTPLGPVEFATLGEGPPVLVIHGSPGGYDQGVALARFPVDAGFRAIVPSRPGYLGTPLDDRGSIDAQADLHAALLDALGIERAGLLFWSGGGPSGYRLAVRHPERVGALVAFDAVSKAIERPHESLDERLMFSTRFGNWALRVLAAHQPEKLIQSTLGAEGSLTKEQLEQRTKEVLGDEAKAQFVLDIDATVSYRPPRKAGLDNDFEQFAAIDTLHLEDIRAPALIVHGTVDTDVPPDHGDHAAATIPAAQLLPLETGTHLCLYTHPEAAAAQAKAVEVLRTTPAAG